MISELKFKDSPKKDRFLGDQEMETHLVLTFEFSIVEICQFAGGGFAISMSQPSAGHVGDGSVLLRFKVKYIEGIGRRGTWRIKAVYLTELGGGGREMSELVMMVAGMGHTRIPYASTSLTNVYNPRNYASTI